MPIHRIRLAGPWEFIWQHSTDGTVPELRSGTIKMPADWRSIFGSAAGRAVFSRRFHRPTNLEPHERVLMVLTGVGGAGSISLNGQVISEFPETSAAIECEVTSALLPFNLLEVSLHFDGSRGSMSRGGLYDPVFLEIRNEPA